MNDPTCPNCSQNNHVTKSGLNQSGSHRYRCQSCRRYFTPVPKANSDEQKSKRALATVLFVQGNSFRQIGRILGVHHQTVKWWAINSDDGDVNRMLRNDLLKNITDEGKLTDDIKELLTEIYDESLTDMLRNDPPKEITDKSDLDRKILMNFIIYNNHTESI